MLPELRNLLLADVLDGITAQLGGTEYQVLLTRAATARRKKPGSSTR